MIRAIEHSNTPVSRRQLIGGAAAAAAATFAFPSLAFADSPMIAASLVAAYNSGSADLISGFVAKHISTAGLERRSAAAWGSLLAHSHARTGALRLDGVEARGSTTRLTLSATSLPRARHLDLRFDRNDPARLFELRQVAEPAPAPRRATSLLDRAGLVAALRERIAFAIADDAFSGTVSIQAPDGPALELAHGWAHRDAARAMTMETPINIGSADKSFTAILIAQLVEEGRLGFDTPILDILRRYPAADAIRAVTVRQLLNHTSGVGSPNGGILAYSRDRYNHVGDLLGAIAAVPPSFAPGSRSSYSNEGFVLLGAAIEAVTGRPYWDVLAERLYRPAGMTASGHYTRDEAVNRCALGYFHGRDDLLLTEARVSSRPLLPWRGNSCGGGYSTAPDIARYFAALRSGRLLRPDRVADLTRKASEIYPGVSYGLGFARDEQDGGVFVGHSGGGSNIGIGVGLRAELRHGWSVALLGNYDLQYMEPLVRDVELLIATHLAH